MNNIYGTVKDHISTVEAAMKYGLNPIQKGHRWWCVCPWHKDSHPSLCIFPDGGFKCFVCGESGQDSIRLTEKLFKIKPLQAVKMLSYDFSINVDTRITTSDFKEYRKDDMELTSEAEHATALIKNTFNTLLQACYTYKKMMHESIKKGFPIDSYEFQAIIFAYEFFDRYSEKLARADTYTQIDIILALKDNYMMEKGAFERWAEQLLKTK